MTTASKTKTSRLTTRYIAVTAVLSALAFVLQLIEIPIPMFMPTFIKFDLSDLPALIGAFSMGPACRGIIKLYLRGDFCWYFWLVLPDSQI